MTKTFSNLSNRFLTQAGILALAVVFFALPAISHADTLTRHLYLGMSGSDVSSLQTFLGTDATIYPQDLVTGYFGTLTQSAVSNFQSRNGIETTGGVGPITFAALNVQMNNGRLNGNSVGSVIGSLNTSVTGTTFTVSWFTSVNTSAILYYSAYPIPMTEATAGSAVTIGGNSLLVSTALQSSHTATLQGLQPNTTYYYVVYVRDGAGNENITWPATFVTTN